MLCVYIIKKNSIDGCCMYIIKKTIYVLYMIHTSSKYIYMQLSGKYIYIHVCMFAYMRGRKKINIHVYIFMHV